MSTMNVHVALPSAQNFHPEFGYFCPSAQVRRKVRSAALTILAGMVIAAGAALALVHEIVPEFVPEFAPQLALHQPGEGAREESTLLVVAAQPPLDRATDKGADKTAADGVSAAMTRPIPVTEQFAASLPQISCDDLSGSFLATQCQLGKTGKARKSHMTRSARAAANQRIATLPIGRADPAVQDEQQRVGQQAEPRKVAASRSAPAAPTPAVPAAPVAQAMDDAPAVLPPEKPAVPAKKPVKTAHAPRGDKTGAEPLAAAPPPAFSLFGLFHEPPSSGGGPLGDVVVERRARAL